MGVYGWVCRYEVGSGGMWGWPEMYEVGWGFPSDALKPWRELSGGVLRADLCGGVDRIAHRLSPGLVFLII